MSREPLRVMQVVDHLGHGGAQQVVVDLSNWLSADHGEHVARRVGVTGPVAARYTQESQEAWVELQQRYGLRIMDALAAQ